MDDQRLSHTQEKLGCDEVVVTLTAVMHKRRLTNEPVHRWTNVSEEKREMIPISYDIVSNIMTTDLITAQGNDPLELVACIMDWKHIRHMPVEDEHGKVVGILTRKRIDNFMSSTIVNLRATAEEVMIKDPFCVDPTCTTKQAMQFADDKSKITSSSNIQ